MDSLYGEAHYRSLPAAALRLASVTERRDRAPASQSGDSAMPESKFQSVNQIQLYRPQCSKCGALCVLEHVEPADDREHDLRTFECTSCGTYDVVKMRFR